MTVYVDLKYWFSRYILWILSPYPKFSTCPFFHSSVNPTCESSYLVKERLAIGQYVCLIQFPNVLY